MTICNTLRRFLCQFPKKSWFWRSRQTRDGYSEFDVFKRSRVMNRCTGMPRTWSGVLWIDFEVKIDLNIILQWVGLKLRLVGQLHNRRIHTDESYRSSPRSGFSCKITPTDIFWVQRLDILVRSGFLGVNLVCKTDNFPPNRVIDDNRIIYGVQSDCIRVKMCDNTFSRGFKRYCMVIGGARDKKMENSILQSCKTRFTKLLKK